MDGPVTFWLDFWNILTLRSGYNATLVILGTSSLGMASGVVGTFAVLRRRALMADALGHATLPGVVGGFLLSLIFGATGPEILPLLIGGACSGLLGIWLVQFLLAYRGSIYSCRLSIAADRSDVDANAKSNADDGDK